jgi:hypothetical protein
MIHHIATVKSVCNVAIMEFDEPSIQDRLDRVRAFARDSNCKYLLGQIDSGMMLVRTARRLQYRKEAQAKCLESARNCEQRAQRSLWRVRAQTARIPKNCSNSQGKLTSCSSASSTGWITSPPTPQINRQQNFRPVLDHLANDVMPALFARLGSKTVDSQVEAG